MKKIAKMLFSLSLSLALLCPAWAAESAAPVLKIEDGSGTLTLEGLGDRSVYSIQLELTMTGNGEIVFSPANSTEGSYGIGKTNGNKIALYIDSLQRLDHGGKVSVGTLRLSGGDLETTAELTLLGRDLSPRDIPSIQVQKVSGGMSTSGSSSGSGSGSSGSSNSTTIKPDGSIITTVTNPDGTKTETTKKPDGTKIETVTKPDGSAEQKATTGSGTTAVSIRDAAGRVDAEVKISEKDAAGKGPVVLPIFEVPVTSDRLNASTVKVDVSAPKTVVIPVEKANANTVAIAVHADGTEEVVPKSVLTDAGLAVALESRATLKIVDNAKTFNDEIPAWAQNSVQFATSRELFQGVGNDTFAAQAPMTRGMLVAVLHRLESTPRAGVSSSFNDIPAGSWYAEAAAWGAEKGIVSGDGVGFSGDRNITRQELTTMLYRYAQTINAIKGSSGSFAHMGGADEVAGWAVEAMSWAVGSGIINGDQNGDLHPTANATRAEVAVILRGFCENMIPDQDSVA